MSETVVRVVAAVISDGDRLLVCQRPLHKRHGGLWEFPGGKCEQDESDAAAAQRELSEELGVDVTCVEPAEFTIMDPDSVFEIAFVPVAIEGTPTCHEHIALCWGTPDELSLLPLAPSDRRFVEARLRAASLQKPH
jgi:8-oxo-dGTP diphosphatase